MSQNNGKTKIVPSTHHVITVNQPMVRDYSTGGGHGPEDTLVEGDDRIVTKKWQGYPPVNLNVVGKPNPPLPEVAIPRFLGTAMYATRVQFPDMLHCKFLVSQHPRSRVRGIDVSAAEKMPGVAYILTHQNAPKTFPMSVNLDYSGALVAIVAADTEDQAEDAAAAIVVDYEVLPFAATLSQVMAPTAPELRRGGNLTVLGRPGEPGYDATVTRVLQYGDVEQGFKDSAVVREFTYYFGGARPVPLQPASCVTKWDGDHLTIWAMCQRIYPQRADLARGLGIPEDKIRFIDKWNGGTFGPDTGSGRFQVYIAHIAKMTGRPTKIALPKDHELAQMSVKPETITRFKVGATKEGKIISCQREYWMASGATNTRSAGGGRSELYLHIVPNWKEIGHNYMTNSQIIGASRSNEQQEFKFAWESMMDEMAEALKMDPVQFRLLNIQKPGNTVTHEAGGPTMEIMPESEKQTLTYDSYASVEVLQEGAKAIGWERRNPVPGGNPGRFKTGLGVANSMHHAGRVGYREGEVGFERKMAEIGDNPASMGGAGDGAPYNAVIELRTDGNVYLHFAQPDSGTNHGTSMAALVSEILGFTSLAHARAVWGDTDLAPSAPGWNSGLTTQLQGGALNAAADKLRKDLLTRAAALLKVDATELDIRDGVISSRANPRTRTTFAALAKANGGVIRMPGAAVHPGSIGRALNRGVGACFAEVEVDTWTGHWRFVKSVYCHDTGNVINPLLAESDMHGSLAQSLQMTTDSIPNDKEFAGIRHYSVGYLSYRLPTIMDLPDQTQVFVNSLEPRWFFGTKGFAETSIGSVPGVVANAIYNACGVRIREHPITREKIMAGLKANQRKA
jgi:CO/xanthine dehydrogenase Mo-binding subunit